MPPSEPSREVLEVLIDAGRIRQRVAEIAAELDQIDTGDSGPILLVGVLKGAYVFLADLARAMSSPVHIDFVRVASYGAGQESSGEIALSKDVETLLEGRHVVLVEDILDSGHTLSHLREVMLARRPASLRIATLLDKPERRKIEVPVDYVGFVIPDRFVVGYGLDYGENYRNLPDVCELQSK